MSQALCVTGDPQQAEPRRGTRVDTDGTQTLGRSSESACVAFRAKVGAAPGLCPAPNPPCPAPGRTAGPQQPPPLLPLALLTLLLVEPPDEAAIAVWLQQQFLEKLPQVDGLPGAGRVHLAVRPTLFAGRRWAAREGGGEWGTPFFNGCPSPTPRPQSPGHLPALPDSPQ